MEGLIFVNKNILVSIIHGTIRATHSGLPSFTFCSHRAPLIHM